MESYIGWIAAVLTVGILYIFSGSGYSAQKKRRKTERKREAKYTAVAGQFEKADMDHEYIRIRQKIDTEITRCSDKEKRELLAKKLYGLKDQEAHHERMALIANAIAVPFILAYIYFTDRFIFEYVTATAIGGLMVLVIYCVVIGLSILRKYNLSKLIYIVEDMLSEMDAAGYEKQSDVITEDLEELIKKLKEN